MPKKPSELALVNDQQIVDPRQIEAINIIKSKRIPPSAKQSRPGKGKQTFEYLSHLWVTETLQEGLGNQWSFEVLHWEVFREDLLITKKQGEKTEKIKVPSVSVAAQCRLTLHLLIRPSVMITDATDMHDRVFDRKITEVGVFEKMPSMPTAMAVASAASRGLVRCVMRGLGLGIKLYKKSEKVSANAAWTQLKNYATDTLGAKWTKQVEEEYTKKMQEAGITSENIMDSVKFNKAFDILNEMFDTVVQEDIPL